MQKQPFEGHAIPRRAALRWLGIGGAAALIAAMTSAKVRGVKYDMAYILDATEAWLA
jgi:hypothetical protein